MENPIKMDDLGGKPTIFGNIHIMVRIIAPKFPHGCWGIWPPPLTARYAFGKQKQAAFSSLTPWRGKSAWLFHGVKGDEAFKSFKNLFLLLKKF